MRLLCSYLRAYLRTEDGANMVEYALIAALISIAAIAILPGVGKAVADIFTNITTALNTTVP